MTDCLLLIKPNVKLIVLSLIGLCITSGQAFAYDSKRCVSWHCYCENRQYPAVEQFAGKYGVKVIADDWGTPKAHQCGISFVWQKPTPVTDSECKEKAQTFISAWEQNEKSLIGPPFKGFVNLSWLYPCKSMGK